MDINTLAKSIAEQATGDKPIKKPRPAMANRGVKRAEALSPERRKEIAKKAAATRWQTSNEKSPGSGESSS
jgi:hypothetical protein